MSAKPNARIGATFARLAREGRTALVPFVTAGWPVREATLPVLHALVEGGADVIELGVPFSDPMADGPMIQRANEAALAARVGMADVLAWVRAFRETDHATPIVLMGYANPIERMGQHAFVEACVSAGVDGVIVVDYPPEECGEFTALLRARGIDPIFLLAPTSTGARIEMVAREASGYVYYVSLKGVTGAGNLDVAEVLSRVARIKQTVRLPVGVGFGIRDSATARAIAQGADAVVIGTRLLQALEGASPEQARTRARDFVADIRAALDAPASQESPER